MLLYDVCWMNTTTVIGCQYFDIDVYVWKIIAFVNFQWFKEIFIIFILYFCKPIPSWYESSGQLKLIMGYIKFVNTVN